MKLLANLNDCRVCACFPVLACVGEVKANFTLITVQTFKIMTNVERVLQLYSKLYSL